MSAQELITKHLDIWTSAHKTRSIAGRGSNNKLDLVGIKKLRELILELAVRGKLVPQDSNDEPASELLKKIAAEKELLIKEGKIKKQKPLPQISDDEKPFELPSGWEFVRLSSAAYSQAGFAFKSTGFNETGSGLPLIRIRDVGQDFSGTFFDGDFREEFVVRNGDYLISMDGNFRVSKWLGNSALLNQRVSRLIFMGNFVVPAFIAESLQARLLELQGVKAYTTVDHLSGGQISESIIGLPPLAEQHRIVAKVDELMAFCDQLEQTQSDNIAAHAQLVEALLATLITTDGVYARNAGAISSEPNSSDHNEPQNNWQRIAAHFDTLFTTEHSIDQLKQTILQLAVMGRLVPQNPNDEPASELLKKIAAEKAQLIKEGKIKKEKPLPEITNEEKPFELPNGWEWVRLGSLSTFENGDRSSRYPNEHDLEDEGVPFFGAKDIVAGELSYTNGLRFISHEKFFQLSNGKLVDKDFIILLRGSVGKIAQFNANDEFKTGFINAQMLIIRFVSVSICDYFKSYCNSSIFQSLVSRKITGTAISQMPASEVLQFLFPLPPLDEQHRIVAKVDELMTLFDTLKTNLQNAQTTQLALADALVEQATT